jgi:poly(A) polymerase
VTGLRAKSIFVIDDDNLKLDKPSLRREFIDYHAIGMVRHLQKAGFKAYLVGGCVRDLMVGHMPKDFDIGTNALPQEVRKLLNYAFIIGRRFRLVLVKREDKQYEVATFRREPAEGEFPEGVPFGDNIFGTPEQDANRRDFTCNAVFYDPVSEKVIDYVEGQKDILDHIIKMIGDPKIRLQEDPIRILRALRFAHKLHFKIDPELRHAMSDFAESLGMAVLPRRREEFLKLLRLHDPAATFREGYDLNLWKTILPSLHAVYENEEHIDLMEERLRRLKSRLLDPADTPLLQGAMILGWLRSGPKGSPTDLLKNSDIYSDSLDKLAKMEMGLHNWEYSRIQKALTLQKILANPDEFKRRGQRRRAALLQSEAFPLGVDLAHVDAILDPGILEFWDAQLDAALAETHEAAVSTHRSQNRPSHKRSR